VSRLRSAGHVTRTIERGLPIGQTVAMLGPLLIVVALVIVIPVAVIISGGVMAVILGHSLRKEGEYRNEGSELLDLNV
jgi:hypothetical protein